MIRIDFESKLRKANLKRDEFFQKYMKEVDYSRKTYTLTYGEKPDNVDVQLNGRLDAQIMALRQALDSQHALVLWLNKLDSALPYPGSSLSKRLLLLEPQGIVDLVGRLGVPENTVKAALKQLFPYGNGTYGKNIADLFKKLPWSVCIYCGRNNVAQFAVMEEDGKEVIKRGYQLDHFFDQADHPYLGLSLFNLVPSCSLCNGTLKGTESLGQLSPWHPDYRFHEAVTFKLSAPGILDDKDKIEPRISLERNVSDYDHLIEILRLEEAYQLHAHAAQAVALKSKLYQEPHIKDMANIVGVNSQTMRRHIFEPQHHGPCSDSAPLSKLSHDIHVQLGIQPKENETTRL